MEKGSVVVLLISSVCVILDSKERIALLYIVWVNIYIFKIFNYNLFNFKNNVILTNYVIRKFYPQFANANLDFQDLIAKQFKYKFH